MTTGDSIEHIERQKPETLRLHRVMPMLTVNNIQASLHWYRDVVGFTVAEEWRNDDGQLLGASLKAGAIEFGLSQDDFKKGRNRKKGVGMRLYGVTRQDVDELAANIKARGGTLSQEPSDQPWGSRDFAVTDPDGFTISIGSVPSASD